ncbi:MAG: hypothetical protein AAF503_03195 [Pseudomonadota bacterium]
MAVMCLLTFALFWFTNEWVLTGMIPGTDLKVAPTRPIRDIGVPMTGLVALLSVAALGNALFRRDMTLYADPDGVSLLAGDHEVGPIHWHEISKIFIQKAVFGGRFLAISLRAPQQTLSRFPKGQGKYRSLMVRSNDLLMVPALFDVSLARAAEELETMRGMYSSIGVR